MRDEFNEYAPDPNSQKSVTDWLMKVISTKPTNLHSNDAAADVPRNGAGSHKPEVSHGSVAVAEMPREEEPPIIIETRSQTVETRSQAVFEDISADDLCGPLVMRPPEPPKDEISADDLCGPLVSKPIVAAAPEALRESAIHVVERPAEHAVTAADISRDSVLNAVDFSPSMDFNRAPEPVAAVQSEITVADITRDSVLQASAAEVEPEVQSAPEVPVAAEPVVYEPVAEVIATEPSVPEPVAAAVAPPADEPVAEPVAEVAPVIAEPEPTPVLENAAAPETSEAETSAAAEPTHEPEFPAMPHDAETRAGLVALEALLTDAGTHAESSDAESVFAHAGIWGEAGRPAAEGEDVYQEPQRRFLEGERSERERLRELEASRPEGWNHAAWKTLLRLGAVLPWIARSLPMFQGGAAGEETGFAQHVRHEVAGLRLLQHEIKSTVQDHSLQLKRMEEQLTRVRVHVESETLESAGMADSFRAAMKMLRMIGIGVGALLLVLILMVSLILAHGH